MIKQLIQLKKEERVRIVIDTVYTSFYSSNKLKSLTGVFSKLKTLVGLDHKYDEELWLILTLLNQCNKQDKRYARIPRAKTFYTTTNKLNKSKTKLDCNRMTYCVDLLESLGLLDIYLGYNSYGDDKGMTTVVRFSDKLLNLTPTTVIRSQVKDHRLTVSPIEIVYKTKSGKAKYDNLSKFKGVGKLREVVNSFNKFLKGFDISLDDRNYTLFYKRVFLEDLEGCGRWYECGNFQTLNSPLRKLIRIDSEDTTEVDVKSIHPSIIASYQGVNISNIDPYNLDDERLINYLGSHCRDICKKAMMCIINTKNKRTAYLALYNEYLKSEDKKNTGLILTESLCKDIIYSLISYNSMINFYGKDRLDYKKLQKIDSSFAEQVISRCINKAIPVLPYHDSFITKKRYREKLMRIMEDSWLYTIGNLDNYRVDIKF